MVLGLIGPLQAQSDDQTPAFIRGVALPLHADDPDFDYEPHLRDLPGLGATHVSLFVKLFQEGARSTDPTGDHLHTPTDATILRTIEQARRLGLEVVLMPIVLLRNPAEDEWRGNLNPSDWERWFENYCERMLHYARLAAEGEASVFVVGSELSSTEVHERRWRELIRRVRLVFPGALTYSANWDHYRAVPFWDALDYIGLSGYYELTRDGSIPHEPTQEQLNEAWRLIRIQITNWRAVNKLRAPLLFLELGYASQDGCARFPWNYTREAAVDLAEQASCYRAFISAWRDVSSLAGVFWYEWWGLGGPDDDGYTPRGKPAAEVIREFFAERR